MTTTARAAEGPARRPDRVAAGLAGGFVVLLVASELVLSLPDEDDSASVVATFYASHRNIIVVLQVLGFVAALLLGGTPGGCGRSTGWCRQQGSS